MANRDSNVRQQFANHHQQLRETVFRLSARLLRDDRIGWEMVCAAMDMLSDSTSAIDAYFALSSGKVHGDRYLRIYGFFQAAFLHQDAIIGVYRALLKREFRSVDPAWQNLRDTRNLIAGHPVPDRKPFRMAFVTQYSMTDQSIDVMVTTPSTGLEKRVIVNFKALFEEYLPVAVQAIKDALKEIRLQYNVRIPRIPQYSERSERAPKIEFVVHDQL